MTLIPSRRGPPFAFEAGTIAGEAQALGLGQPPVELRDRSKLAREADFAESDDIAGDRLIALRRDDRQREGEIRRRLADAQPADDRCDDVLRGERQAQSAAEHRGYEDQAVNVEAVGCPARRGRDGRAGKRLDLYEHRPATFQRGHDRGPYCVPRALPDEYLRRVLDRSHALACHLEYADLIDRPEAVLYAAQKPVAAEALAFEIEDDVDDVLEQAGAGDVSVLRDVADDEDRDAGGLAPAHQLHRGLAELGDAAGRLSSGFCVHRLDGVDDEDSWGE